MNSPIPHRGTASTTRRSGNSVSLCATAILAALMAGPVACSKKPETVPGDAGRADIGGSPSPTSSSSPSHGSVSPLAPGAETAGTIAEPSRSDKLAGSQALEVLAADIQSGNAGTDEMRKLADLFAKEHRDEAWASSAEYTIANVVSNLNGKYGPGLQIAKAECRQTVCEVRAINRKGVGGSPLDWNIAYLRLKKSLKSSNSQTLMRPLPDGQVVYQAYIIR